MHNELKFWLMHVYKCCPNPSQQMFCYPLHCACNKNLSIIYFAQLFGLIFNSADIGRILISFDVAVEQFLCWIGRPVIFDFVTPVKLTFVMSVRKTPQNISKGITNAYAETNSKKQFYFIVMTLVVKYKHLFKSSVDIKSRLLEYNYALIFINSLISCSTKRYLQRIF